MFWTVYLSIVGSPPLYTAIGICHTGFAECLLVGSWSWRAPQSFTEVATMRSTIMFMNHVCFSTYIMHTHTHSDTPCDSGCKIDDGSW